MIEPAAASRSRRSSPRRTSSPREQQITELIARGSHGGDRRRLYLSAHTVRDYVKAIFEKAGVSSRGELVARLFAEHYAPLHT